ncbi:MAG: YbaK/EbsC family protein [Minisyncoccales bacterium]
MKSKKEETIKVPKKVAGVLAEVGAKYELIGHRTVYTAFDKAATLKIKPGEIAKVLVIKVDGKPAMAVIGGDRNLDMDKLIKLSKAKKIDFAKEKIIGQTFKGIDPGAIPPFAGLWNVKVFCDKKLLEAPKIILPSGSYEASLKITSGGLKKINPEIIIGNFSASRPKKTKTAKSKFQNKSAAGVLKRKKK